MKNIVIIGSSGHAKVVVDTVEKEGSHKITGVIDPALEPGTDFLGYPVLADSDDELPRLIEQYSIEGAIVAIGDNWRRYQVAEKIQSIAPSIEFVSTVHPSASIGKNVRIGRGTVVFAGTVVNADSTIGDFCILNTRSSIDHDGKMADYSSLAPGATVGGNVSIGDFTAVSLGANILHNITIGEHAVIGAGSLINKSFGAHEVIYGVPGRKIRTRDAGEKYL